MKQKKAIPKTQIGLTQNQKEVLKQAVGAAPKLPVDHSGKQLNLNDIRDWMKQE